jgi:hypothetical protein
MISQIICLSSWDTLCLEHTAFMTELIVVQCIKRADECVIRVTVKANASVVDVACLHCRCTQ